MTTTWGVGYGTEAAHAAARRARSQRANLSPDDQIVLDAAFGNLAAKERAALLAPESPEVLYFLGDWLYHRAPSLGWDEPLARARAAFERSTALDSQATVLHHLVEIALVTRDSALLHHAWPAYDHLVHGADPGLGWLVAATTDDARLMAKIRRRSIPDGTEDVALRAFGWLLMYRGYLTPQALEEQYNRTAHAIVPQLMPTLRLWHLYVLSVQGRPAAAARVPAEGPVAAPHC